MNSPGSSHVEACRPVVRAGLTPVLSASPTPLASRHLRSPALWNNLQLDQQSIGTIDRKVLEQPELIPVSDIGSRLTTRKRFSAPAHIECLFGKRHDATESVSTALCANRAIMSIILVTSVT